MKKSELYKISRVAKDLGITKATLWNWKSAGKIQFIKDESNGYCYIDKETYQNLMGIKETKSNKVVIYCRVSSSENKSNLETQKQRLVNYANAKGYSVDRIVEEIGSGFNDKRPKLESLLNNGDFTILFRLLGITSIKKEMIQIAHNHGFSISFVNPEFSSQTCSVCGHISKENRKNQEEFICVSCGHSMDADINSSINLEWRIISDVLRQSLLEMNLVGEYSPKSHINMVFLRDIISNSYQIPLEFET